MEDIVFGDMFEARILYGYTLSGDRFSKEQGNAS